MRIPKPIKKVIRNYAKTHPGFRRWARNTKAAYKKWEFDRGRKNIAIEDKLVYFNSFVGRSYGDSPKAIYEYMLKSPEFSDYKFVWMFRHPENYEWLLENRDTRIVTFGSAGERDALRRAKYWITNYRMMDRYVPNDEQVYVQCWHGTPLKRLGYDLTSSDNAMNDLSEIREKYEKDAARFKYMVSPSAFVTEKYISAWNLEEYGKADCIIEEGYPRNDRLKNATEDDIRAIKDGLQVPEDKKIILYAPTWRDNQHKASVGYTYNLAVDFDKLREYLGEKYVILFRAHYLVASEFDFGKYSGFVWDVSKYDDINDLYLASDMLVTDYSSVMFDYANLRRPVIFYMYDLEEYRDNLRGFYFDIKELPGPIVTTEEELKDAILAIPEDFRPEEKYIEFCNKYNYLDDGHATERVVARIFRK